MASPEREVLLACRDVRHAYLGRFPALDGVTLDVRAGETLALLGANGCGKSTLLRILDGLVFPDAGELVAFGQPITEATLADDGVSAGFRSRVGFVFQDADAMVFAPTVREELAFGPLQLGLSREEVDARVLDVLALLEIGELADRAPHQLSGGQKKRVALGAVLAMAPQVLLFDEPTAGLDPRGQEQLLELLVELRDAGRAIVLATHDLGVLEWVCDRCVVFSEQHRILREGPPATILGDRDLLLAANLIHPHLHRHQGVLHAHPPEHRHEHGASTPAP